MARSDPQLNIRIPTQLKMAIEKVAKQNGRSVTSEMLNRLLDTFHPHEHTAEIESIREQLDMQRTLAKQFQAAGDLADYGRSIVAALLLAALDELPIEKWPKGISAEYALDLAQWLSVIDPRGAAFSILQLIDGSNPQRVETLRVFADAVETIGLDRVSQRRRLLEAALEADEQRGKKVVFVGNVGSGTDEFKEMQPPKKSQRASIKKKR